MCDHSNIKIVTTLFYVFGWCCWKIVYLIKKEWRKLKLTIKIKQNLIINVKQNSMSHMMLKQMEIYGGKENKEEIKFPKYVWLNSNWKLHVNNRYIAWESTYSYFSSNLYELHQKRFINCKKKNYRYMLWKEQSLNFFENEKYVEA